MSDPYPEGLFTWADLASADVEAAKRFYGGLFGWEASDLPAPGGGSYTMFTLDGKNVAGLGQLSAEQQQQGIPSMWSSYISVADVEVMAEAVTANGGSVAFGPMSVGPAGSMLFAVDPGGAMIGFWQPGEHRGADHFNDPGFMTWNELQTRDLDASLAFYPAILPMWTIVPQAFDDFVYHTIMIGDRPNGGMMAIGEDWPEGVPSNWQVYFRVADADEAANLAGQLGGKVMLPPSETQFGKFSVIADPEGAVFTIMGPAPQTD